MRKQSINLAKQLELLNHNRVNGCYPFKAPNNIEDYIMVNLINAKKEKKPTKKALMQEISSMTDLFNVGSLERTNIENLIVIVKMLKAQS